MIELICGGIFATGFVSLFFGAKTEACGKTEWRRLLGFLGTLLGLGLMAYGGLGLLLL